MSAVMEAAKVQLKKDEAWLSLKMDRMSYVQREMEKLETEEAYLVDEIAGIVDTINELREFIYQAEKII